MSLLDLENLPYFSLAEVKNVFPYKAESTIKWRLSSQCKKGVFHRLKRWYYVSDIFLRYQMNSGYKLFIANKMYAPSYISLVTALDYYGILSESSFHISSVTINKTAEFTSSLWTLQYKNIKTSLFTGFVKKQIGIYEIYIASKAKALFDYFWYQKKRFKYFSLDEMASFRLNLDEFSVQNQEEFQEYVALSHSLKMKKIYSLIIQLCD